MDESRTVVLNIREGYQLRLYRVSGAEEPTLAIDAVPGENKDITHLRLSFFQVQDLEEMIDQYLTSVQSDKQLKVKLRLSDQVEHLKQVLDFVRIVLTKRLVVVGSEVGHSYEVGKQLPDDEPGIPQDEAEELRDLTTALEMIFSVEK